MYKINNSNTKKFFDQSKSYSFIDFSSWYCYLFISIWASFMNNLSAYSHIIFYYNTRIYSK